MKRNLRSGNVLPEAKAQLASYAATRTERMSQRYVRVLTDGREWHLYNLRDGQLVREIDGMDETLKTQGKVVGELTNKRSVIDASGEAADAMTRAQLSLAAVATYAQDYVQVLLAKRLPEEQVSVYRDEHQGPLLVRARELFRKLTLDRYLGLDTDTDDKGIPFLLARTADDKLLDISALSTGTRDQLYLALRLAALEQFIDRRSPLPLMLDDLLRPLRRSADCGRPGGARPGRRSGPGTAVHPSRAGGNAGPRRNRRRPTHRPPPRVAGSDRADGEIDRERRRPDEVPGLRRPRPRMHQRWRLRAHYQPPSEHCRDRGIETRARPRGEASSPLPLANDRYGEISRQART